MTISTKLVCILAISFRGEDILSFYIGHKGNFLHTVGAYFDISNLFLAFLKKVTHNH